MHLPLTFGVPVVLSNLQDALLQAIAQRATLKVTVQHVASTDLRMHQYQSEWIPSVTLRNDDQPDLLITAPRLWVALSTSMSEILSRHGAQALSFWIHLGFIPVRCTFPGGARGRATGGRAKAGRRPAQIVAAYLAKLHARSKLTATAAELLAYHPTVSQNGDALEAAWEQRHRYGLAADELAMCGLDIALLDERWKAAARARSRFAGVRLRYNPLASAPRLVKAHRERGFVQEGPLADEHAWTVIEISQPPTDAVTQWGIYRLLLGNGAPATFEDFKTLRDEKASAYYALRLAAMGLGPYARDAGAEMKGWEVLAKCGIADGKEVCRTFKAVRLALDSAEADPLTAAVEAWGELPQPEAEKAFSQMLYLTTGVVLKPSRLAQCRALAEKRFAGEADDEEKGHVCPLTSLVARGAAKSRVCTVLRGAPMGLTCLAGADTPEKVRRARTTVAPAAILDVTFLQTKMQLVEKVKEVPVEQQAMILEVYLEGVGPTMRDTMRESVMKTVEVHTTSFSSWALDSYGRTRGRRRRRGATVSQRPRRGELSHLSQP